MTGCSPAATGFKADFQGSRVICSDVWSLQGQCPAGHVPVVENVAEMLAAKFRWLISEQAFYLAVHEAKVTVLIKHEHDVRRAVNDVTMQRLGFLQPHLDMLVGFEE